MAYTQLSNPFKKNCSCYEGYSRVQGTKPCAKGSCKKSSPMKGKISASCKAQAKKKFKVWPSAYASGWGVRCTRGDFKK
tara:strand:+ start:83 stop:319 length:237 start_codon:yes stop_codon:yes gene_type:complete